MLPALLSLIIALATGNPEATMPTAPSSDPVISEALANPGWLSAECARCEDDPIRYDKVVMGGSGLWSRQKEIMRSVVKYRTTVAPAGNGVGKSYVAARIVLWFLACHRDSIVVTTAPTQQLLQDVLWSEIRLAMKPKRDDRGKLLTLPFGGKYSSSPLKLVIRDGWYALGLSGSSVEAMSGKHKRDLLFLVDEGSGVDEGKFEAGNSLNPSRTLVLGNPLRPSGKFFELSEQSGHNPYINRIRIPSTESPHAKLERSPVGMADRTWLEAMLAEYGELSIWWKAHVLALFPTETAENVVKSEWLDLASRTIHVRSGPTRLSIDLAKGNGGDKSVILVRDDNGILALEFSNEWSMETTAAHAARLAREFKVHPARVSFDAGGLGEDFANRLAAVGLPHSRPFHSQSRAENAKDLRSAATRLMKWRLDPGRMNLSPSGLMVPQPPFAIRPEWMAHLRPELLALRYVLADDDGSIFALEDAAILRATLKRSPDFYSAFNQSFAFPD